MFWEALLLGLVMGWLRKGRIKELNQIYLTTWPLIFFALLIQGSIWIDFYFQAYLLRSIYHILYTGSFILLLASIVPHRKDPGLVVIGAGILLNMIVISANGGMMPVDSTALPPEVLEELTAGKKSPFHTPIDEQTLFAFLGDRITLLHRPNQLLSIGDLLIAGGVLVFIQRHMLGKKSPKDENNPVA